MRAICLFLIFSEIISSAVALDVVYDFNLREGDTSSLEIVCFALFYDHESPLYSRLFKEGVDEPIINVKFYGWYNGSNQTLSNNSLSKNESCYSTYRAEKSNAFLKNTFPCFTGILTQNNKNFWWCGYLGEVCGTELSMETLIRFRIGWKFTNPFIHSGNYTCQIEQNGTRAEQTFTITGMNIKISTHL